MDIQLLIRLLTNLFHTPVLSVPDDGDPRPADHGTAPDDGGPRPADHGTAPDDGDPRPADRSAAPDDTCAVPSAHAVRQSGEVSAAVADFARGGCFDAELQPLFTPEGIAELLARTPQNTFLESADETGVSLMTFRFAGQFFAVGPYAREIWNESQIRTLFGQRHLRYSAVYAFRLYYTALPLFMGDAVAETAAAVLSAFAPEQPAYHFVSAAPVTGSTREHDDSRETGEALLEAVYSRYRYENRFLGYIRDGDADGALSCLGQITRAELAGGSVAGVYKGTIYLDPRVSYSILRTLVRKAAEEAGLSVITIDTITQRQAQLSAAAHTSAEQAVYIRDMIREMCEAVRKTRLQSEGCSQETCAVMEYLRFHYAEPVRLDELTAHTHYSKAHLCAVFRKDTGKSITAYIASLRCRKAGELLRSGKVSVADAGAAVGYPDCNYFIKVFRRETGMTPGAYRSCR